MFGVDMSKPGAQEYYDSVFELLGSWGVDFVKVDDISRPYHGNEIAAIRRAIDRTGRPMVLSLSPGEAPLTAAHHVRNHANMWRISNDFWDHWHELVWQFGRLRDWAPHGGPGRFPDADMLPIGVVDFGRRTQFSPDEQITLLTLWSIARSPLIMGGDLTRLDSFTLSLLTNDEILEVNQRSEVNRELYHDGGLVAWSARATGSTDLFLAVFNTYDSSFVNPGAADQPVPVNLADLGVRRCRIRDLWRHADLGEFSERFAPPIRWHGAGMYRLSECD
jgi:hypothetical protein